MGAQSTCSHAAAERSVGMRCGGDVGKQHKGASRQACAYSCNLPCLLVRNTRAGQQPVLVHIHLSAVQLEHEIMLACYFLPAHVLNIQAAQGAHTP